MLAETIRAVHSASRRCYGVRRIHAELTIATSKGRGGDPLTDNSSPPLARPASIHSVSRYADVGFGGSHFEEAVAQTAPFDRDY